MHYWMPKVIMIVVLPFVIPAEWLLMICGMKINGIPRLACYTKISELATNTITCEPLPNFPYIRDLVTDFSQFINHHRSVMPYIQNKKADIPDVNELTEYEQTQKI